MRVPRGPSRVDWLMQNDGSKDAGFRGAAGQMPYQIQIRAFHAHAHAHR